MNARQPVAARHPGGTDRNRDLKLIHIAKKQLAMNEDAYRAIVRGISNQRTDSSGALTGSERQQLLNHFKSCGFRASQPIPKNMFPDEPSWNKLWSNWQKLADQGKVIDRRGGALASFVRSQTKVEAMSWVAPSQLDTLIEQTKQWLAR